MFSEASVRVAKFMSNIGSFTIRGCQAEDDIRAPVPKTLRVHVLIWEFPKTGDPNIVP